MKHIAPAYVVGCEYALITKHLRCLALPRAACRVMGCQLGSKRRNHGRGCFEPDRCFVGHSVYPCTNGHASALRLAQGRFYCLAFAQPALFGGCELWLRAASHLVLPDRCRIAVESRFAIANAGDLERMAFVTDHGSAGIHIKQCRCSKAGASVETASTMGLRRRCACVAARPQLEQLG